MDSPIPDKANDVIYKICSAVRPGREQFENYSMGGTRVIKVKFMEFQESM